MTRRSILIAALLSTLPSITRAEPSRAGQGTHPNIILMMADDLGHECLECYGGTSYETPVLNRLAAEGVRFDHCYSQPVCTPSRNKIMTGRSNARNYYSFGCLSPDASTFGHVMRSAGYKTCIAGKWQLSGWKGVVGMLPEAAGFDSWLLWQIDSDSKGSRYWNPKFFQNGRPLEGLEEQFGPDVLCQYVLDFVEANRNQPFFVYYPMVLPHGPHIATPDTQAEARERYGKKNTAYFPDMVRYCDQIVGRVVTRLEELGLRENTLLLFTGDNGTDKKITSELGDRLIKGGKGTTPDAGTHVPLIASWPGTVPSGIACSDLIDFGDFLPTFAEMGQAELPHDVTLDGRSFLPQLRGEPAQSKPWVFCHYDKAKDPEAPKSNEDGSPRYTRFVRDHRYKLYSDGKLYDVPGDWEEKTPLENVPEIRARLQAVLDSVE